MMQEASPQFSHIDFWDSHDTARPGEDWDIPGTTYGGSSLYEDFPHIMKWDDSGAVEALSLAGKRQDAMAKGLPWIAFLPHPGMYLEKVNWDVRESWDMPDSADSFAAKEDQRHHSRNRGGRSHGRWRNQNQNQDYRNRDVGKVELPMHDVWPTDKSTPLSWGTLPVPTGWGDVAVEQGLSGGELTTVGGAWADSGFSRQADVPCSSTRGQSGPPGWGSCQPAEDHVVSMGWGDQPVGRMQSEYDQQQTHYDEQQTWTYPAWPAQHMQPSTPMLQQQHQRLLEQQHAHSQAVDVRWQNQRYSGLPVEPRPWLVSPDCSNGCGAPVQEFLPGTLQQRNFQDRPEVGGGQKYHSSQHYGWDCGGPAENRNSGRRNSRDRSGYTVAPPPAQDVWKQQWQPVANIGHGTGVYY